jgi:hypothetical protein
MAIIVESSLPSLAQTYEELQDAVINYTHRTDLGDVMPLFIRLAEDVIFGDLSVRTQDTIATLNCTAEFDQVTLPTDFINVRTLTFGDSEPNGTIDYITPDKMSEDFQFNDSGKPAKYTIVGSSLILKPTPDTNYELTLTYEARLARLSETQTTNWLLTNFPAVYLYASMVQDCLYIKKDISIWAEAYIRTIEKINMKDWSEAGPLCVRHNYDLTSPAR